MIRILVVDDKTEKQGIIVNVIKGIIGERENVEIMTVTYVIDAKRILLQSTIDIMILDICLPLHPGDDLQKDGGIKLLKEIKGSVRYTYPRYVISLSEHEELTKEFSLDTGIIHTSIYYNALSNEWSIRLAESIKAAVSIMENNIIKRSYDYDIAIICALSEELEYVKQSLLEVEEFKIPDDDYIFLKGYFVKDGRKIRVVIAQSTQKGMVPAAALTTKLIYSFAPKYVAMTGIAAGIKEKVNMGDAVVAEYVWDYGAGKEVIEENETIHRNTIEQIQLDTSMSSMVRHLSNNARELAEIKQNFHGNKPDYELKLHIGAVATGAAVIANPQKVKEIQNQIRDVMAIEMEIFGVYYAARWSINPKPKFIAIKSICDFADEKKTDDFHFYASYVSAKILEKLAKEYFVYDD